MQRLLQFLTQRHTLCCAECRQQGDNEMMCTMVMAVAQPCKFAALIVYLCQLHTSLNLKCSRADTIHPTTLLWNVHALECLVYIPYTNSWRMKPVPLHLTTTILNIYIQGINTNSSLLRTKCTTLLLHRKDSPSALIQALIRASSSSPHEYPPGTASLP